MQLGWRGFFMTVALTATLTSAAWLLVSFQPYDQQSRPPDTSPAPRLDTQSTATQGKTRSSSQRLIVPVQGVGSQQLTDTFSEARANGRLHDAIDIMAPLGTAVIAAAAGRVEKLFVSKAGGNTVYQRSPDGYTIYYYAHLDRYAPTLAEGGMLQQGDPIGTVGYSGNANPAGPHLHFAVMATSPDRKWWETAAAINPFPLLTRP